MHEHFIKNAECARSVQENGRGPGRTYLLYWILSEKLFHERKGSYKGRRGLFILRARVFSKRHELSRATHDARRTTHDPRPTTQSITCTFPIMYHICPPKFCISIVFNFYWDGCNTQEKWKTKVMQSLGWQIRCIMGNVQVAYQANYTNLTIRWATRHFEK